MGAEQIHTIAERKSTLRRGISLLPRREEGLRVPVRKLFPAEQYLCNSEVPFGLKRIDMLFRQRTNGHEMVAVELKLRNWKRAIWQAATNRQIATYSYVALPWWTADAVDKGLMASLGLGLIVAESVGEARIALQAKRSHYVNTRIAKEISVQLADY